MLKVLPIGIQTFSEIRENNMLYVDKTEYCCKIAKSGKYFFLSRPRRFGKSLLLSTFKSMFEGRKDLFDGLYAEDNWDWDKQYPILHFAFNNLDYDELGLEKALYQMINIEADKNGITLKRQGIGQLFQELIEKLCEKSGKVVVLIDEYDKPLIDYLTKDKLHKAYTHRSKLRDFYGALKNSDPYLHFVFITGISKFSQTSIFSQLNNLYDLTLHPLYGAMLGYTETELHFYFKPYLEKHLGGLDLGIEQAWEKVKLWYNGYTWNFKDYVYNPFSILQFMERGVFENFWFQSGAPKFLIDLLAEKDTYRFEDTVVGLDSLNAYNIEDIEPIVLLFQTGYLTFKSRDEDGLVVLDYPNREVRNSLYQFMLSGFSKNETAQSLPTVKQMQSAFLKNDAAQVATVIDGLFASIPHDLINAKLEKHFQAIVYIAFRYLGVFIQTEVKSSDGRADAVVYTPERIWILEFKINKTADEAFQQITDKNYAAPFRSSGKIIYGMGLSFSTKTKRLSGWKADEII